MLRYMWLCLFPVIIANTQVLVFLKNPLQNTKSLHPPPPPQSTFPVALWCEVTEA